MNIQLLCMNIRRGVLNIRYCNFKLISRRGTQIKSAVFRTSINLDAERSRSKATVDNY
jgi:hypothetical protein